MIWGGVSKWYVCVHGDPCGNTILMDISSKPKHSAKVESANWRACACCLLECLLAVLRSCSLSPSGVRACDNERVHATFGSYIILRCDNRKRKSLLKSTSVPTGFAQFSVCCQLLKQGLPLLSSAQQFVCVKYYNFEKALVSCACIYAWFGSNQRLPPSHLSPCCAKNIHLTSTRICFCLYTCKQIRLKLWIWIAEWFRQLINFFSALILSSRYFYLYLNKNGVINTVTNFKLYYFVQTI